MKKDIGIRISIVIKFNFNGNFLIINILFITYIINNYYNI